MTPRERLQHLITILENVGKTNPNIAFDMRSWIQTDKHKTLEPSCFTAACAFGHAALDPKFIAEGLHPELLSYSDGYTEIEIIFVGRDKKRSESYRAASKFFDISFNDALYLFCPSMYGPRPTTPENVIERIQEILDRPA